MYVLQYSTCLEYGNYLHYKYVLTKVTQSKMASQHYQKYR